MRFPSTNIVAVVSDYLTVSMNRGMVDDDLRNTSYVHDFVRAVGDAVRRRDRVSVSRPDPHVVAGCIVAVVSAVTAGKAEERHGGHPGGSENHGEDVEIHLYGR